MIINKTFMNPEVGMSYCFCSDNRTGVTGDYVREEYSQKLKVMEKITARVTLVFALCY